ESAGHLTCTAPRGHTGPHTASDGDYIVAVDPARPTVTDDARAVREAAMDLYRAMRRANPDAWAEADEVEDWAYWDDIVRTAQVALAAGRAEAWAEGHRTGWEHCQDGNYGNDHWDDPTPNPYAAAARAEMTAEQPCRHCGSCDGPPSCPDCDHADRRAETTTATTEDAVGELLKRMSNAVTRLEALRAQNWDASEGQRPHGKIEGVKLAASYVEEARDLLATARTRPTREQIDRAVGEVLSNASNHPDPVAVLGRSIAPLRNKITDAVLELLQDSTR